MKRLDRMQWRQLLIALGVSLTVALLLNWAILKVFGRRVQRRAEHSLNWDYLVDGVTCHALWIHARHAWGGNLFLLALVPC